MESLSKLLEKWNKEGIRLPMIRVNGNPSITATFAFISFNTALLGQIGKVTYLIGNVDLDAANYLFFGCLFAYLGRRYTAGNKTIEVKEKEE